MLSAATSNAPSELAAVLVVQRDDKRARSSHRRPPMIRNHRPSGRALFAEIKLHLCNYGQDHLG
jgi:hypothetical protein